MLKRLRKAHPILFCVLAEVVFLASLFVTDLVFTIALVLFRADFASIDTYLYSTLQELVGAMVAVLFLVRTDRAGLLRRRGSGFFNGLLVGMYPLVFIGYNAFGSLVLGRPENGVLQPAARICTFLVSMAMVGVAEEFIFRGVIAQTLLEHFGTSRAGVWKACLLSGVLFGAAHLTNILSSAPFGVLMQCVFAASLGTLFAAIYFRTGNLWVTVFLHGAMDIFVHAHRWAVRHHYRGRCGKRLRCIHAAFGAAVSDPHRSSAAQKEAAGGTAVLAPVRKKIKAGCKKYPCILHRVLVYCICYRGTGLGVCPLFGNAVSRRCSIGT